MHYYINQRLIDINIQHFIWEKKTTFVNLI